MGHNQGFLGKYILNVHKHQQDVPTLIFNNLSTAIYTTKAFDELGIAPFDIINLFYKDNKAKFYNTFKLEFIPIIDNGINVGTHVVVHKGSNGGVKNENSNCY